MKILDFHLKNSKRRQGFVESEEPETIRQIGLEQCGIDREYCAFFARDGTITYTGKGRGLEGKATGKGNLYLIRGVFNLLSTLDLDSFADDYQWEDLDISPDPDSLFNSIIFVKTNTFSKSIFFSHGATPPIFRLINAMLDVILDSAEWDKEDFLIQRALSDEPPVNEPPSDEPPVKRKWRLWG
jgi:hypothetical protein